MPLTPIWIIEDTFTDSNGTLLLAHTSDSGAAWLRVPGWGMDDDNAMVIHGNAVRRPTYTEDVSASGGEILFYNDVVVPDDSGGFVIEADITRNNTIGGAALEIYKNAPSPGNKDILCWIGANGQPVLGYLDPSVGSVLTATHLLRYETDFTTASCYLDGGLLFSEAWEQTAGLPLYHRTGTVIGPICVGLYDQGEEAALSLLGLRIGYVSATASAFWQDFTKTTEIVPA